MHNCERCDDICWCDGDDQRQATPEDCRHECQEEIETEQDALSALILEEAFRQNRALKAELAAGLELHQRAGKIIEQALGFDRQDNSEVWLFESFAKDIARIQAERDETNR